MKRYKELDLKKIREECGLDFAHYTYGRGQCSCCYGPFDMAARHWRGGKKPIEVTDSESPSGGRVVHYELDGKRVNRGDISYILFKNACNGSGRIKNKEQPIEDYTCIGYRFSNEEQKLKVCQMLLDQLDEDYALAIPKDDMKCIIIVLVDGDCFNREETHFTYRKFGEKVYENSKGEETIAHQ